MSIRASIAWSMASQYLAFIIQFGVSVVISRLYLSPSEFGVYSVALAASMLVSMFQDAGITRFVSGQRAMDPAHVREYAGVAVSIACTVAVVLGALAPVISHVYHDPTLIQLTLIIAAASFVNPFALIPVGLLTREMNFRALFFANILSSLSGGLLSIYLAAHGFGPASMAWGLLLAAFLRTGIVMRFRTVVPRFPRDWATTRPLLSFSANSFFISASGAIGMRTQDLIVARLLGVLATGLFSRATALSAQLSTLVTSGLTSVFYPAFARKRDAGDPLAPSYLHLTACNTAVNWAAMVGLGLAAGPLVHLLYGPKWAGVAVLLKWTALSETLFVAVPLQMDVPILLGRIRTLIWVNWIDTAIIIGCLTVACFIGVEAAAASRIVYGLFWVAIYGVFLARLMHFRFADLLNIYWRSAVAAYGAGIPLIVAQDWLGMGASDIGWGLLIALSATGIPCWLACLFLVRHPATIEISAVATRVYAVAMVRLGRRSAA
ncbi:O-antigen/teichoic acid export membrane protein [Novosphingobium sp. SG751A]|uniref:oligosaccharide flippase family protein n=1 Tax=Novosphingobium sp. SG751A TaxID=2587000 RepID=UPI001551D6DB|nr:oligosaccharide flippase family protein [Novosphingobium sp. SG751A]NOW46885.1 O-antigen/teichoic acid export membrane protein [Novosphingobium sp. SG751A]